MRQPPGRLAVYLGVGGLVAGIYLGLIFVLVDCIKMRPLLGVSIAYVVAVFVHFLMNRHLTFDAGQGDIRRQGSRYLLLLLCNYLVTMVVVHLVADVLGAPPMLGAIAAIVATVGLGFVASRRWIFR